MKRLEANEDSNGIVKEAPKAQKRKYDHDSSSDEDFVFVAPNDPIRPGESAAERQARLEIESEEFFNRQKKKKRYGKISRRPRNPPISSHSSDERISVGIMFAPRCLELEVEVEGCTTSPQGCEPFHKGAVPIQSEARQQDSEGLPNEKGWRPRKVHGRCVFLFNRFFSDSGCASKRNPWERQSLWLGPAKSGGGNPQSVVSIFRVY